MIAKADEDESGHDEDGGDDKPILLWFDPRLVRRHKSSVTLKNLHLPHPAAIAGDKERLSASHSSDKAHCVSAKLDRVTAHFDFSR